VTPEEFDASFDTFKTSAFRLETLQSYAVSAEDAWLRALREGLPRPERSIRTSAWLRRIAASTMAGKSWSRARLVRHPLSEYLQYEIFSYIESAAVGEETRIVDLGIYPHLKDLGPDFWYFDADEPGEFAIVMHYDADGNILHCERTTELSWCREQREAALSCSISLAEYLASRAS
jgi:hypothetical protein